MTARSFSKSILRVAVKNAWHFGARKRVALRLNEKKREQLCNCSKYFLENHSQLIQLFKRVSPQRRNDNYQIVIKAKKVPSGEHAGWFNAPTVDEVAVIMVGDPVNNRANKIPRRDSTVSMISDLHRAYDALHYTVIFWQGQDQYHISIKQYDPVTGNETEKKDACLELQLLEDDNHWDLTLADAALTSIPHIIRQLFAIILTTCYPTQSST
ncbi:uncharacterized protein TNIN_60481 [Trichonephila inaurata madagascariensis]|uniref:Uncharacterized protein n=1 Tax=Trichonephila inaurata madagascariensis TaxID=2747483 RepID=A0A8X7CET5_9ARAC|nr:uncharacterized protein TNIN_60481 [Trichonephila inaurata madagascariensis]